MNVFIVGSPLSTAKAMVNDTKRFNKQIVECKQILAAINGETKAWRNHPCTKQYANHKLWLDEYRLCLIAYREGKYARALLHSWIANFVKPSFHTQEFFDQMKRRLYTKDNNLYSQYAPWGVSHVNWYWSPTEKKIIKYVNGKRI